LRTVAIGTTVQIGAQARRQGFAPMAGVTDLPDASAEDGATLPQAMLAADERLWDTKVASSSDHTDEPEPRVVQIAGGDPDSMADAARRNVDAGAQIIDINMGCPAKKVCNRDAGSALLRDEPLVARILAAVVSAVSAGDIEDTMDGTARTRRRADRAHAEDRHGGWRSRTHARVSLRGEADIGQLPKRHVGSAVCKRDIDRRRPGA
jgi:hypothetical protein